jgi:hypothetical protein
LDWENGGLRSKRYQRGKNRKDKQKRTYLSKHVENQISAHQKPPIRLRRLLRTPRLPKRIGFTSLLPPQKGNKRTNNKKDEGDEYTKKRRKRGKKKKKKKKKDTIRRNHYCDKPLFYSRGVTASQK